MVFVEVLVLGADEGVLHHVGISSIGTKRAAFLREFVDDPPFAGIDAADRGRRVLCKAFVDGRSREYIQKIAPMVSAPNRMPSVIAVKIAPKKEPMNLTTRDAFR